MVRTKTLDQIEAMKDKAARFLRDVVGDPDRADDFEAMSPEDYAEHKGIAIENPDPLTRSKRRRVFMARPTYADLKERIDELEEENQGLNERLDSIVELAASEEVEDEGDEDEEEEDDDSD